MKYIIILGDGMADEPVQELDGRTPLEAAHKPFMDRIALEGRSGLLHTVPNGYAPGSEIAHLSLLGYDLARVFEGRGSLEAASMGIDIEEGELAMRCNLITIENQRIKNHSAGHISTEEANELICYLQQELGDPLTHFYAGVSYRHLLKIRGGSKQIITTPPHDVPGTLFSDVLPTAKSADGEGTASQLRELILRSQELLENHPINLRRKAEGADPANSIWPWSPGYRPQMKRLTEQYSLRDGVVISAVDLIKGIGVYAGLRPIDIEGATGLYDTNYEGKASAAIQALKEVDFVFIHIEAPDEAGHQGDPHLKVRTIEDLDRRVVQHIYQQVLNWDEELSIAILPDHPTPCAIRTHSTDAVPFVIWRKGAGAGNIIEGDSVTRYDERSAAQGDYGELHEDQFIKIFLDRQ